RLPTPDRGRTMTRLLFVAALGVAVAPAFADDPKSDAPKSSRAPSAAQPSPYHPAGIISGRVKSVSAGDKCGGSITISAEVISQARTRSGRGYLRRVDKDVDYDLAEDVKVRFGFRPKSPAPPDKLPGYKAESSDVHAGQVVKLTLGKQ